MIAVATLEMTALSEILDRLGNVPPVRVHLPKPRRELDESDWLRLPNRQRYELVDGILVEKPMGWRESWLGMVLGSLLTEFVIQHRLGIVLGADGTTRVDGQIRLPDVAFYSRERLPAGSEGPVLEIAPDLAVEVLSPSNTVGEMIRKRGEYFRAGTRAVWEIEPELRQIRVYSDADTFVTLGIDDTLTGEPVLPGFSLGVRALFERVDGL
jgi:Uma2 family endonuclease